MKTAKQLKEHGYEWVVKVAYNCDLGDAGDILSKHYTCSNAEKASKKHGNFTRIVDINAMIFDQAILND